MKKFTLVDNNGKFLAHINAETSHNALQIARRLERNTNKPCKWRDVDYWYIKEWDRNRDPHHSDGAKKDARRKFKIAVKHIGDEEIWKEGDIRKAANVKNRFKTVSHNGVVIYD